MDSARTDDLHVHPIGNAYPSEYQSNREIERYVAMAIQRFAPIVGGGELQLERLLPFLAEQRVGARVLTRAVKGPAPDVVAGTPVHRTWASGESPGASLNYVAGSVANILRRRRHTDLVHAHGMLSPATIGLAARRIGIPFVVTPLGAGPPGDIARLQQKPGGRRRLEMLVRHAHFVALSNEIVDELRAVGVPENRARLVRNGVDHRVFRPAAAAERVKLRADFALDDSFYAVFVGRLHPVKNLPFLLHVLSDSREINLLIVGDGPQRADLERLTRALELEDRVQFIGESTRVQDLMRAADAFVLPSIAEGMSNALAEAMACGLPCVASSTAAGVRELFGTTRGLTADPDDKRQWSTALHQLSSDGDLRVELGSAAANYVRAELSLERTAGELAAYYFEIVSES
jgi:glycosyltransferase involved in cell wall biosynthesis